MQEYNENKKFVYKPKKRKVLWGRVIAVSVAVLLVLALVIFGFVKLFSAIFHSGTEGGDNDMYVSSASSEAAKPVSNYTETWENVLVSAANPMQEGYVPELSTVSRYYAASESVKVDSRILEPFENMCRAASNDGVSIFAASAFRSVEIQTKLFNKEVQKNLSNNPGMSTEEAEKRAATVVNRPGTSEHNLGLAIDINTDETSFKNTAEYRWLKAHSAEYGFVERYPEDKTEITGIIFEPWHYRYVGVENAKKMNVLGMCLEEYINYLKNGGK